MVIAGKAGEAILVMQPFRVFSMTALDIAYRTDVGTDATLHALVFLYMKPLVGDEHLLKESAHNKRFHVEKDKCVKCGICANVCPVGDIKGGHGEYPEWLHHKDCLTCFTCYHHCPHHAIEFGRQTQKKGQYFYK